MRIRRFAANTLMLLLSFMISAGLAGAEEPDEPSQLAALLRELDSFYGNPTYTAALSGDSLYWKRSINDETCEEKPFLAKEVYTRINLCLVSEVGLINVRPFPRGEALEFSVDPSLGTPHEIMTKEFPGKLTSFSSLDEAAPVGSYPIVVAKKYCSGRTVLAALKSDFLLLREAGSVHYLLERMTKQVCGDDNDG